MKLIVQPDAGLVPIVQALRTAKRSIAMAIFRFDQAEIEKAMAAAVGRGPITPDAMISAAVAETCGAAP